MGLERVVSMGTPPWLDRAEYPFASRWVEIEGARMHYVDEGQGPTVLMVHGTPTWSFLYRHLVRGLRGRFRCIVPDHLGFGLSDKPAGDAYRPQDQARRLAAFVAALGLGAMTLVVHDFGGPIGLAHAIEHPDTVRHLVLFNTWMWSFAGDRRYERIGRVLASPVGRFLYERLGASVNVVFRRAMADRTRYTKAVHAQYAAPQRSPAARHATWIYAREVMGAGDWYDGLWRRRERLAAIPALLIWGLKDKAFGTFLPRWRTVFRDAEAVELAGVGHAPPEERGPECAALVAGFLGIEADRRTA
jgi:haloalkane dehalogenase